MVLKIVKLLLLVFFGFVVFSGILFFLTSFFGWYGYKKWEHRVHSTTRTESIKRGVFVKDLKFDYSDEYSKHLGGFSPFIERGFTFGKHSSKETIELTGSKYPYQLSFNNTPVEGITIYLDEDQLQKFDSSNSSWGYMGMPNLSDTIIVKAKIGNMRPIDIKVW